MVQGKRLHWQDTATEASEMWDITAGTHSQMVKGEKAFLVYCSQDFEAASK